MPSAIDELIEAAEALPPIPETGSQQRKDAQARLRKAVAAAKKNGALSPADLARIVEKTPLCGVTRAAKILGVKTPNFRRYRDRLTEIPVQGAAAVFVVAEVEALAAELKDGR